MFPTQLLNVYFLLLFYHVVQSDSKKLFTICSNYLPQQGIPMSVKAERPRIYTGVV
jgi:hypothetical protein